MELHHLPNEEQELSGRSNQASVITPEEESVSDDAEMEMNIDPYLRSITGHASMKPTTASTPATSGRGPIPKPSSDTASSATLSLGQGPAGSLDDDVEMSVSDVNLSSQEDGTSKANEADNEGGNAAKSLMERLGIDKFTDDISSGTKWGQMTSTRKAADKSGTKTKRGHNAASNRSLRSKG